jgi:hypothetical protein
MVKWLLSLLLLRKTLRLPAVAAALLWCQCLAAAPPAPHRGVNVAAMQGWDIVIDPNAIASERYAAEQFQHYCAEASGVRLPVVEAPARPDRHVFIGPGAAMRAAPADSGVANFGPEDLRIVVRNDIIAIAGGRPRGTLYGVYTFLEDYLGVRFLTHDHTHVPPVGG